MAIRYSNTIAKLGGQALAQGEVYTIGTTTNNDVAIIHDDTQALVIGNVTAGQPSTIKTMRLAAVPTSTLQIENSGTIPEDTMSIGSPNPKTALTVPPYWVRANLVFENVPVNNNYLIPVYEIYPI